MIADIRIKDFAYSADWDRRLYRIRGGEHAGRLCRLLDKPGDAERAPVRRVRTIEGHEATMNWRNLERIRDPRSVAWLFW